MRNITIKQYATQSDVWEFSPLQFLEPCKSFGSFESDIDNMTYEEVKSVIRAIRKLKTWDDLKDVFETVFGIDTEEFWNSKVKDFFAARNFVIDTFKRIVETENKLLQSITKDYGKWVAAGGERLNRFSDVLPLVQLGKIYGMYPFELKDKKYKEILLLLTIGKEQREIETKMHDL